MADEHPTAVDLLIHPIGELATAIASNKPLHGSEMSSIVRIKDAAIAIKGEKIFLAGAADEVLPKVRLSEGGKAIDASGKLVIPGLVDPHTHLVFAGNRAGEFAMRCQGKTYQEIAKAGGGIVASMNATRNASVQDLVLSGQQRLQRMLAAGTTSCEIKTGYGLSIESELRMLEAILKLQASSTLDITPTFMPAHAYPPEVDRHHYVRTIIDEMLPRAAELISATVCETADANKLIAIESAHKASVGGPGGVPATVCNQIPPHTPIFQDVFCDEGYFTLKDTRDILDAGMKYGFRPKVHADEFANLGASSMAVEIGAASADHLLNISDAEIELMAESDVVAVLLPGTSFFLNLKEHARARCMIDRGIALALGSDFNPGSCHIYSLIFIWGLACLHLKMTTAEALTALTVNAAFAAGLGHKVGQLRSGYQADLLVTEVGTLEEIPYNMVSNPICMVFKRGQQLI